MSWTAPILTSNGTRTKTGVVPNRRYSHAVPAGTGVSSDRTVVLGTAGSARNYPDTLRRVRFVDPEQARSLIFLTNNFELPALTIAPLYKSRWRIELFFKWIKQNLRIKAFYGVGENAVKTQLWIAVASYQPHPLREPPILQPAASLSPTKNQAHFLTN